MDITAAKSYQKVAATEKDQKDSTDFEDEDSSLLSPGPAFIPSTLQRSKLRIFFLLLPWMINICLGAALIYLTTTQSKYQSCVYGPDRPAEMYSPAHEAIEYTPVSFRMALEGDTSPYQGWPTDEKDQLWQDLYDRGVTLRLSEQDHDKLINKTEHIPVAGYENERLVGLDVFHQLHCLNQIRMAFYPRRYNTSMVDENGNVKYGQWLHIDHCIESIRESLTCHSDISVNGFEWMEDKKILMPTLHNVHMCRNFSKIREWAFPRFVNLPTKRMHVENGKLVDYRGDGPDPEQVAISKVPKGWNYTVDDL
ncbi:hypothetical protein QBC34DRAFT_497503 [Podospora aff. communis PSN243]|uniref:Uncharacterized protein n=1 Tax=Podospora aff. communis PSN243 TaxID=3040156 RepID=A0AAV9GCG8_9PEZI|nr:hypothetical protein QBC34DRAFT_497503 [Podospora aff. communis PSN243]